MKISSQNRKYIQEQLYDEIEQKLELLGSTIVEDKLQDGVSKFLEFVIFICRLDNQICKGGWD